MVGWLVCWCPVGFWLVGWLVAFPVALVDSLVGWFAGVLLVFGWSVGCFSCCFRPGMVAGKYY
jgi:hypothetical protein